VSQDAVGGLVLGVIVAVALIAIFLL